MGYHYHYLEEQDYLSIAKREGESLAVWYQKVPDLQKELASIGFYLTVPFPSRLRYILGDLLVNRRTIPYLLNIARFFSTRYEDIALKLYCKI